MRIQVGRVEGRSVIGKHSLLERLDVVGPVEGEKALDFLDAWQPAVAELLRAVGAFESRGKRAVLHPEAVLHGVVRASHNGANESGTNVDGMSEDLLLR